MNIQPLHEATSDSKEAPFPIIRIILGIVLPVALFLMYASLFRLEFIQYRPWLAQHVSWVGILVQQFSLLMVYSVLCGKNRSRHLIRSRPHPKLWIEFAIALLLAATILLSIGLITMILKRVFQIEMPVDKVYQSLNQVSNSYWAIAAIVTGIAIAPFCEELYVRGFLYNAIKTRVPIVVAILLQAIIFSVLHFRNYLMVFFLSIALAWLYERRKTLWAPIFFHGIMNTYAMLPIAIMMLHNFHVPASNWSEAPPTWHHAEPDSTIAKQENATQQRLYAIKTWGSHGQRKWKQTINAFEAVCFWFPEDRPACAFARLGIATVYCDYLRDYRRAIKETERILSDYSQQREACARALAVNGWSHYRLKNFHESRDAFSKISTNYSDYSDILLSAKQGILQLDALEQ
jgi:membrane protease YdiL (CAAX protease family)